jgi:hypothetical protein
MRRQKHRVSDVIRHLYAGERFLVSAAVFIIALVELIHMFR